VSQVGAVGYYFAVNLFFGLSEPEIKDVPIALVNAQIALVFFWLCSICTLGVYLYERLQQKEFEARRQLQIFLHGVSHDLRNPVTSTLMVLQNLWNQPEEPIPVSHSIMEQLVQGSKRQLQLIDWLSEANANKVRSVVLHLQPMQLSQLVQSSITDLEAFLTKNRAIIKNLIPEDLPLIDVDTTGLWRVLINLIINALKHNPPGLILTISATVEPHMIRCCIQDNGVGMTQQECEQLFDFSFRSSRTRNSLGLDSGLYVCQQIITAHGGKIGVISFPGAGTTVWFTLPLHKSRALKF
jgi:signal transduction histidine kinase